MMKNEQVISTQRQMLSKLCIYGSHVTNVCKLVINSEGILTWRFLKVTRPVAPGTLIAFAKVSKPGPGP